MALGGVGIANHFLDELNALAHIMIREVEFSLEFVFSWQAMLVSVVLCFLTVLFSAWLPAELFYLNRNPVRLIVPKAQVGSYSWVMNIAIVLAIVFMYCFVVLLMLIGLTNVISTLSTNVMMRSREFAVLKSIGMTPESLKRMLNFESILCSLRAFLYGLPIGIAVTCLINLPIRSLFPVPYRMPWLATCLCGLAVFLITWSTTRYAAHKLEKQNLIETIRTESGK